MKLTGTAADAWGKLFHALAQILGTPCNATRRVKADAASAYSKQDVVVQSGDMVGHTSHTNTALTQREFQLCLLPRQPPQHILILHISHLMSQHMELSLHAYNGSWRRSVGAEVVYTPAAGVFAAVVMPTTGMAAALRLR